MVWSDERKKTHNRTPRTIVYPVNERFVAYGVEVFRCSRRRNEAKKEKKMYQNHWRWNCIPNEMSNTHTLGHCLSGLATSVGQVQFPSRYPLRTGDIAGIAGTK